MSGQIDLTEYLFRRLYQLGVRSVHGVPGDYNLTALDYVSIAGLNWVGNASELGAGYAADGYAKIKGLSAVITASGVGELSIINAIAGSYAEMVPVVHIVGTPPIPAQDARLVMHHTLGDGDFRIFADMAAKITCAQASLRDPIMAIAMIDETIQQCILQSRPVYIELPTTLVRLKVSAAELDRPINLLIPENDTHLEEQKASLILEKIYAAKQPFIVVDGLTSRFGFAEEVGELVRATGIATAATPFGKGIINEHLSNFHGVYAANAGDPAFESWVHKCDLVLYFGPLMSDFNTYGFITIPERKRTIAFHRNVIEIGDERLEALRVKSFLRKVLNLIDQTKLHTNIHMELPDPVLQLKTLPSAAPDGNIDQHTFWKRISSFFRTNDVILVESGTSSLGGSEMVLPPNTTFITGAIWLSIGYMLGAAQGVSLALRDASKDGLRPAARTIVFEGDGSFQMTVQSISDIIRNRLDVTIFVINNDGYVIERLVHGMTAEYNDIQPWRYLEAFSFFGAPRDDPAYPIVTRRVENWGQLNDALAEDPVQQGKGLIMVEVIMGREDVPASLRRLVEGAKNRNAGP
ncbi:uncharacterized protein A1O5_12437 [Cladophialophora psammophila CBS 110553]|uniref:Pyruvate decarboxylase n=1 Tax=Cladophialophora psammophila CBS 110553 TaxID=1182543 RepID=W9WHB0_9EURO|nr:uncharacterized protein A1O5_12437 [Cladophialophora psammophila CBS 110553]EXJ57879.1 hypothetical protein A1O5_12437 [Cladophialophora psammophila CBS 110553]